MGVEKLHQVFIKYEIMLAIKKATPLASDGAVIMKLMKADAINTCKTVTSKPEMAKRKAFFTITDDMS